MGPGVPDAGPRPASELAEHLEAVTGVAVDDQLLLRALTHRSFAYEAGGVPHNERLEFLGDSVLGLVVTDALYAEHPELTEGNLAKLRAAVVNMRALASVARAIGLGAYLRLGRGEESTGGRDKDSLLADTTEAVIGAVYLTGGMPPAALLVHHLLDPVMAASATMGAGLDWKTSLQEAGSLHTLGNPEYRVAEEGPEHAKTFKATVLMAGVVRGAGSGRTKKDAEQKAAEQAWLGIRAEHDGRAATTGA
ncbi:MAG: ribonuclease III [Nostocoides sp.]